MRMPQTLCVGGRWQCMSIRWLCRGRTGRGHRYRITFVSTCPRLSLDVARFRTSSHRLRVETGRWEGVPWRERVCLACGTGAIQDEKHVLMDCSAFQDYRERLHNLFAEHDYDMASLMQSHSAELSWFVHFCMRDFDHGDWNDLRDGEQPN